jgi:hypothetical protein
MKIILEMSGEHWVWYLHFDYFGWDNDDISFVLDHQFSLNLWADSLLHLRWCTWQSTALKVVHMTVLHLRWCTWQSTALKVVHINHYTTRQFFTIRREPSSSYIIQIYNQCLSSLNFVILNPVMCTWYNLVRKSLSAIYDRSMVCWRVLQIPLQMNSTSTIKLKYCWMWY